ncbi:sugar ABC transporter substrate-binding protein [Bradyrhizobium sp. Pha-3]|uniref:sugar ABC transporter substrate-binding protein n=1 Tax=Bradyrhizobium sp. Pha-3 TaxID=208375 RepID=UPI0035D4FF14
MVAKRISRRVALGILGAAPIVRIVPSLAQGLVSTRPWRVAYANTTDEIPFAVAVLKGLKEAARKRPRFEMTWLDNRNDAARAVEIARTVASSGYDLFIEYNSQQAANRPIAGILSEEKIKALSIQTPLPGYPIYMVDNWRSGSEGGRALVEQAMKKWPGTAPVAMVIGSPELGAIFQERANAARKTIEEGFPGLNVVEFSSKNDAGNTRQLVFDTLTRFPGQKIVIWVHLDSMALAVLAAARNAKRESDVLIASTGGDAAVFPEIRKDNSALIGTYSFFPELWGEDILSIAEKILLNEPVPEQSRPSQAEFITRDNITQFYPQ